MLPVNEGHLDRIARIVVGLVFISLALNGNIGAWGWIGVVPFVTGAIGFCPLYRLAGYRSCGPRPRWHNGLVSRQFSKGIR